MLQAFPDASGGRENLSIGRDANNALESRICTADDATHKGDLNSDSDDC